jgi:NDP-sugar pyrophosphorylase family protein
MEALILAGGFAKRLSPLTDYVPKALLPVGGRPIIDHVIDKIDNTVDRITISTNYRFFDQFDYYVKNKALRTRKSFRLIAEEISSNEKKLGIVGALSFAFGKHNFDSDVLVLSSDKIYDFNIQKFLQDSINKKEKGIVIPLTTVVAAHENFAGVIIIPKGIVVDKEFQIILSEVASSDTTKDDFIYLLKVLGSKFEIFYPRIEGRSIDLGVPEEYKRVFENFLEGKKITSSATYLARKDKQKNKC